MQRQSAENSVSQVEFLHIGQRLYHKGHYGHTKDTQAQTLTFWQYVL